MVEDRLHHFVADAQLLHVAGGGSAQIVHWPAGDAGRLVELALEFGETAYPAVAAGKDMVPRLALKD